MADGLKPGGLIIINSPKAVGDYPFPGMKVAIADVTTLASEVGLPKGIVNTGIIGAFAKASELLDLDVLLKAIEEEFEGKKPHENAEAARLTYENTEIVSN